MWYEILPAYIAITTFLAVPNLFMYFTNKLALGQPYRRKIGTMDEAFMYLRDGRLSKRNFAYDFSGLENIPDLDEHKKAEEEACKC